MSKPALIHFLLGAVCAMAGVAVLFFFKFWMRTRDRLFLAFAAAFLVEGLTRAYLLFSDHPGDAGSLIYLLRLLGYLIVLGAIVDKNRGG